MQGSLLSPLSSLFVFFFFLSLPPSYLLTLPYRNVQTALTLFDNAATQARNNKYFYIQALAHELAARCLEESGMTSFAEISVKKALEGYSSWGAVQKVILEYIINI